MLLLLLLLLLPQTTTYCYCCSLADRRGVGQKIILVSRGENPTVAVRGGGVEKPRENLK